MLAYHDLKYYGTECSNISLDRPFKIDDVLHIPIEQYYDRFIKIDHFDREIIIKQNIIRIDIANNNITVMDIDENIYQIYQPRQLYLSV